MFVLKSTWKTTALKDPVIFREGQKQFIIRIVRNNGVVTMFELEMDDDKAMRSLNQLPEDVQAKINQRLKVA